MSRLTLPTVETATGSTREMFNALEKGLGMVPNMALAMSTAPVVLQSWLQFNGAISAGRLPGPIREQIALLTAELNGCSYCLSAHTALGGAVGLTADEIDGARDGASSDPRTAAALSFTRSVVEQRGGVAASELDQLRDAGFDDGEIVEIVGAIALNLFTNVFNRTFDVDIDFPRVEPRTYATG